MHQSIGPGAALCVLLVACGSPAPGGPDGSVHIDNPERGAWQRAEEVPFRFLLEQTFGVEADPSTEVLGLVNAVTTDSRGNVYLLDSRANRVLAFDEYATLLWSYDQSGEGPGELQRAYALAWNGGDHLFVSNQANTRIEILDTAGQYVDTQVLGVLDLANAQLMGLVDSATVALSSSVFGKFASSITVASVLTPWSSTSRFETDAEFPQIGRYRVEVVNP